MSSQAITRKITISGVHVEGTHYFSPALYGHVGKFISVCFQREALVGRIGDMEFELTALVGY